METDSIVATQKESDRLPGLDGIRALAVLLVLLGHFCPPTSSVWLLDRIITVGGFGVDIFFVLSGFLITYLLLKEEEKHGSISIRLFYARRALRILPPLFAFVLFLAILNSMGFAKVPAIDYVASLLFVRNVVGSSLETGHLWTLAIEEQFYLAWPVLLVAGPFPFFVALALTFSLFLTINSQSNICVHSYPL